MGCGVPGACLDAATNKNMSYSEMTHPRCVFYLEHL